jgi:hypothetical protein
VESDNSEGEDESPKRGKKEGRLQRGRGEAILIYGRQDRRAFLNLPAGFSS